MTSEVPEGWKEVTMGRIISENNKSKIQVGQANDTGKYRFFTSGESVLKYDKWLVDGENLFMATGGVANVKYFDGKCAYSTDTYSLKSSINTQFLYYLFSLKIVKINYSLFEGTGLKHLQKPEFKDMIITIPKDPKEQEKIATILETIDHNIDKTKSLIEKNRKMKEGVIQNLFKMGITENFTAHTQFQDSKLGKIPKNWEINTIQASCDIVDYRGRAPPKVEVGVFLVTSRNIKNGIIDYSLAQEYVPENKYNSIMNRGFPKKGDVLITTEAPCGEVANVDIEMIALAQRIIKLRGKQNLNSYYLKIFLETDLFQRQLEAETTGSTVKGIKGSRLVKMSLLTPKSKKEQEMIVSIVNAFNEKIKKEQDHLQKLSKIKSGLMQDLLTGKVRVAA